MSVVLFSVPAIDSSIWQSIALSFFVETARSLVNLRPDDMHTPWVGDFEQQQVFPDGQESEKNFRTVLSAYDKQIGRLLSEIRKMDLDNNTIVIFTSDNGPAPGFKGSRAGNLRGCKASLFEGGIRMPFIIRDAKEEIPSGKVDNSSLLSALDLYKSLCSFAGISLSKNLTNDGEDMSKALKGTPQMRKNPLFREYRRNAGGAFPQPADKDVSPSIAIRQNKWKLLVNKDGSKVLLYDLDDNPRENMDASAKYPQVVKSSYHQGTTFCTVADVIALNFRLFLPFLLAKPIIICTFADAK